MIRRLWAFVGTIGVLAALALLCVPTLAAQTPPPPPDTAQRRPAQKLPTTTIREQRELYSEAYLRRSRIRGTGKFLTARDIEKIGPPHTAQLLARVSGGSIRDIGGGNSVLVGNRGTRMTMSGGMPSQLCIISLAVNDVHVPAGFDIRAIKPEDIGAIEFYNGPSSIPLELGGTMQGDANCGMFVIWLKDRRRPK